MKKSTLAIIILIIVALVGVGVFLSSRPSVAPSSPQLPAPSEPENETKDDTQDKVQDEIQDEIPDPSDEKPDPPARDLPAITESGEATLSIGDEVALYEDAKSTAPLMRLRFDAVTGDNRCPQDVVCIQAGAISVAMTAFTNGTQEKIFFSSDEVDATYKNARIGIDTIAPLAHSQRTIAMEDYAVTFRVTILPLDVHENITSKENLIRLFTPKPATIVTSPLRIVGEARGNWFFEADFPVELTDWEGSVIARGIATAEAEWMTIEFVPFSLNLTFDEVIPRDAPDFMRRGTLILHKQNASGLPEHADSLEIPVRFE